MKKDYTGTYNDLRIKFDYVAGMLKEHEQYASFANALEKQVPHIKDVLKPELNGVKEFIKYFGEPDKWGRIKSLSDSGEFGREIKFLIQDEKFQDHGGPLNKYTIPPSMLEQAIPRFISNYQFIMKYLNEEVIIETYKNVRDNYSVVQRFLKEILELQDSSINFDNLPIIKASFELLPDISLLLFRQFKQAHQFLENNKEVIQEIGKEWDQITKLKDYLADIIRVIKMECLDKDDLEGLLSIVDIDNVGSLGDNLLLHAVQNHSHKITQHLLKVGINPFQVDALSDSAFSVAITNKNLTLAKQFIEAKFKDFDESKESLKELEPLEFCKKISNSLLEQKCFNEDEVKKFKHSMEESYEALGGEANELFNDY